MKAFRFLFLLIVATVAFSAQFEIVKDVTELPGDLTAQRYGYKDVNGQWCAILKVHSDIEGILFEGMGYEKHDYKGEGIYLVYMQPESKSLKILKGGYIAKLYDFPYKLKANTVYQMEVSGVGEERKIEKIAIKLQTEPADAKIMFDDEDKSKSEKIITALGNHKVIISKDGYQTIDEEIEVSTTNTFFNYKLNKLELIGIVIKSEPSGATVFLEGVKYGVTPLTDFYPSGSYKIKLSKEGYVEKEDRIQITKPQTDKFYNLTKNSGNIVIVTDPEKDLDIYIDGSKTEFRSDHSFNNMKFGTYKIRAQSKYYETEEKEIELGKLDTIFFKTRPTFATLTINTNEKAEVYLNGEKITQLKDIKLEPQKCNIEVRMKRATTLIETISLKKNENRTLDIFPEIATGSVQVAVLTDDADIELWEDGGEKYTAKGMKIFDEVPVGSYKLKVSKKGFVTINKDIIVEKDKTVKEVGINLSEILKETTGKPSKPLKNNIDEINKLEVNESPKNDDISLNQQPEQKKSKKWWYIGGGSVVVAGVLVAVLIGADDAPAADTSANISLHIPIP